MEYQVKLRNVLCVLCLSAAVCLTGCGISFGGYLPGGREELVFVCGEELPPEESGAGFGLEETSAPEPAGSLETEVSEESTVPGREGRRELPRRIRQETLPRRTMFPAGRGTRRRSRRQGGHQYGRCGRADDSEGHRRDTGEGDYRIPHAERSFYKSRRYHADHRDQGRHIYEDTGSDHSTMR